MTSVHTWRLIWFGQVIECPQCQASAVWELRAEDGRAWAVCERGHETEHPLVYPAVVDLAVSWVQRIEAGEPHSKWREVCGIGTWKPHRRDASGTYQPWNADDVDWFDWPQLIEGKNLRNQVQAWVHERDRLGLNTDTAMSWTGGWGTVDPDKTVIELKPTHAGAN